MASKVCSLVVSAILSLLVLTVQIILYFVSLFRLHLAALHFNENSERKQATTKDGEGRYAISKPKYKPGAATAKAVKEGRTYSKSVKSFTGKKYLPS